MVHDGVFIKREKGRGGEGGEVGMVIVAPRDGGCKAGVGM